MSILVPILIIGGLILLNGIFVAAEFSVVAAPRMRIARRAEEGDVVAGHVLRVLNEADMQGRYITTAQIGVTVVSLALGMYGEYKIAEVFLALFEHQTWMAEIASHTMAVVLSVSVMTYLHVVLGEMIPKTLALQKAESTVIFLHRLMMVLEKLFYPVVVSLIGIASLITRMMGIRPARREDRLMTAEELEYIVEESSESGLLEVTDQLFIENILDLQERTVEKVMTPRNRVTGISVTTNIESIRNMIMDVVKTRYPVYEGTVDNIIGVVHIKDLARYEIHHADSEFNIQRILRPIVFVPETLTLYELLLRFRKENLQIAVVLDEFGGTAGIITLEDLVEEVVGEIQDEFDEHESPPIEILADNVIKARGDLILDELNQLYRVKFQHPQANTIGGLIMDELGRIPEPDDTVTYKGIRFVVVEVKNRAVKQVLVYLPEQGEEEYPEE